MGNWLHREQRSPNHSCVFWKKAEHSLASAGSGSTEAQENVNLKEQRVGRSWRDLALWVTSDLWQDSVYTLAQITWDISSAVCPGW